MGYETKWQIVSRRELVYTNVRCDGCQIELKPAVERELGADSWDNTNLIMQPRDTLVIELKGFYGGYFDCDVDPEGIILCKACADELLLKYPLFRRVIDAA